MAVLYEYNYNESDQTGAYGTIWDSQTFTPQENHTVTSVKLKVYKVGTGGGTYTVSIRATSSGLPTGADLCSGTFAGGDQTTNTAGAAISISLGAGTALTASTKYAIVWRGTSADVDNRCFFKMSESGSYTNGSSPRSSDSGSSWADNANRDHWFEEYATGSASASPSPSPSASPSISPSPSPSMSPSVSPSPSPSISPSVSPSNSLSTSISPSASPSISPSSSPSASPSISPSPSPSISPSSSPSVSVSLSLSASPSVSPSPSPSISPSASPSVSPSPSPGIPLKPVISLVSIKPKISVSKIRAIIR